MTAIAKPTLDMSRVTWPKTLTLTVENVRQGLAAAGYVLPDAWPQNWLVQSAWVWRQKQVQGADGVGVFIDPATKAETVEGPADLWMALDAEITEQRWQAERWGKTAVFAHTEVNGSVYVRDWVLRDWNDDGGVGYPRQQYSQGEPRPSWDGLREHVLRWYLDAGAAWTFGESDGVDTRVRRAQRRHLDLPHYHDALPSGAIDIGDGLEHLPALIHLKAASADAGESPPRASMLTTAGVLDIWTMKDVDALLRPVAHRKNVVESARNVMRRRAYDVGKDLLDPNGGLDASADEEDRINGRTEAIHRIDGLLNEGDLYDNFAAVMRELESEDDLPPDLPSARQRLLERLEAYAMAATKAIMKAASQQGVDRDFSCVDEQRAAREVAEQCVLGARAIENAEDTLWKRTSGRWEPATEDADLKREPDHAGAAQPDASIGTDGDTYQQTGTGRAAAKAAHEAAVAAIVAVTVLNVPELSVDGAAVGAGKVPEVAVSGRAFTVTARHPNAKIKGQASIPVIEASYTDGSGRLTLGIEFHARRWAPKGEPNHRAATVTIPRSETKPVVFIVTARNLCGPSYVRVTLTPPSTTPINPLP